MEMWRVSSSRPISYMTTPYNRRFAAFGYPELDIKEWEDGEKAIIQYHQCPIIPSLTKWSYVLTKLRNVDITDGFIVQWTGRLDMEKQHFWDEEEKLRQKMLETQAYEDRRAHDYGERAFKAVRQNPALMERIARNGLKELGLLKILRNIPKSKLIC